MENEQMRLMKIHLTLLNAAVHAIAAAQTPDIQSAARCSFDALAESAKASLLQSMTSDRGLAFFDELRESLLRSMGD